MDNSPCFIITHEGTDDKRGSELVNLKTSFKTMAFSFYLVKIYAINKLCRSTSKVLLGMLLAISTMKELCNLGSNLIN